MRRRSTCTRTGAVYVLAQIELQLKGTKDKETKGHWTFEMHCTDVIAIVVLFVSCGESQVSLERTTPSGMLSVCQNATAVFTCQVTGFNIIGWTSTEYVGESPVDFTTASANGSSIITNGGVAVLTQNSDGILESQLHIRASVNASIRCFPDNVNDQVTVNLTVYNGFPGRPTGIGASESLIGETCVTNVKWDPPPQTLSEDIDHYIVRTSIDGVSERNTTSTLVSFQSIQCPDNVSINVSVVDRCGQEGLSVNTRPNLDSPPDGGLTRATTDFPNDTAIDIVAIVVAVTVVAVVLTIFFVILLIVIIVAICFFSRRIDHADVTKGRASQIALEDPVRDGADNKGDAGVGQPKYSEHNFEEIRCNKKPQISPREREQDVKTFMTQVVILLHTVKDEELVAVYNYLKAPLDLGTAIVYQTGREIGITLGMFGNHKAAVIQSKGGDCQRGIEHALTSLPQVQLIIAVGFAYGRRGKCKLGDVLVSTTVETVSKRKFNISDMFKKGRVGSRRTALKADSFIETNGIGFVCTSDAERESEIHRGVVVNFTNTEGVSIEQLIAGQDRFIGGQVKGLEGVTYPRNWEQHDVDFIVIKGIADFGDGASEKDWKYTASLAAAELAEQRLTETQNRVYCWQHTPATGPYLTINDLDKVKEAVQVAQAKWRNIGQNVGIQEDDLKTFEENHYNPELRLAAVLTRFLQQDNPKPTWKRLADVMANVGHGDIAEQLHEK